MRQIVLDTETTGLSTNDGHRIIEIGAVELVDRNFSGNRLHHYINPEREVEAEALSVHGITNEFLADKPIFSSIMDEFVTFISGSELIIHNAPFDVGFLNNEFRLVRKNSKQVEQIADVFDTLVFARKKHPGKKNSLDALCKRYGIDNSERDLHGALLDAQLLAELFLLMTGGQMSLFAGGSDINVADIGNKTVQNMKTVEFDQLSVIKANSEELHRHQVRLDAIKAVAGNCLWRD